MINYSLIGQFPEVEDKRHADVKTLDVETLREVAKHFYGIEADGISREALVDMIAGQDSELEFA